MSSSLVLDKVSIYSDASFDHGSQTAVLGFFYIENDEEATDGSRVKLTVTVEENNIRAELRSVLLALDSCPRAKHTTLYTDCAAVANLIERREKLEKSKFISKSKGLEIRNADLYKSFYNLYDQVVPNIVWLKGHMAKMKQKQVNKNFSVLDKAVRKKLQITLGGP